MKTRARAPRSSAKAGSRTRPGGLAEAERIVQQNEVYNTRLRLIFYDEPVFGHYQQQFDQIFRDSRYTDLRANLSYFGRSTPGSWRGQ